MSRVCLWVKGAPCSMEATSPAMGDAASHTSACASPCQGGGGWSPISHTRKHQFMGLGGWCVPNLRLLGVAQSSPGVAGRDPTFVPEAAKIVAGG